MRSGLTIMISCQDKECSGLAREQDGHRPGSRGDEHREGRGSRRGGRIPIDAWPEAKSRKDSVKVPCIEGLRSNQSGAHLMVCKEVTDS